MGIVILRDGLCPSARVLHRTRVVNAVLDYGRLISELRSIFLIYYSVLSCTYGSNQCIYTLYALEDARVKAESGQVESGEAESGQALSGRA